MEVKECTITSIHTNATECTKILRDYRARIESVYTFLYGPRGETKDKLKTTGLPEIPGIIDLITEEHELIKIAINELGTAILELEEQLHFNT